MSPADSPARATWLSGLSALASTGTLVCCVLPLVMVMLGFGAVLAGWVSAFPALIWWSEQKALAFGGAGALLALAGFALYRARSAPCPIDPALARACARNRRISAWLFGVSAALYGLGAFTAFLLPRLVT